MSDIMTFIRNKGAEKTDPDGNLLDLDAWDEARGRELAKAEEVEMTDDHWEVVRFLRDDYRQHGEAPNARTVLHKLEERFARRGGKKFLYQLFPRGPAGQASRIAGLPVPAHSTDPSFGSVQ